MTLTSTTKPTEKSTTLRTGLLAIIMNALYLKGVDIQVDTGHTDGFIKMGLLPTSYYSGRETLMKVFGITIKW